MKKIKTGDLIKLVSLPKTCINKETCLLLSSMLNKKRRVYAITADGSIELMTYKTINKRRIYHFILVEPQNVKLVK